MTHAHKLLVIVLMFGCGGTARVATAPSPAHPSIDSLLATLTVRQKVAQLVTPWLAGTYAGLDDSASLVPQRWVDSLQVGGIYISIGSPHDIAAKLNELQRRSRIPLLVSSDLERGAGMRLVGAATFPNIMAVGATGEPLDAYTIGRAAALEGRAVGIHVNFAPDADLNNNPLNPIINTRSFGEDPKAVSRLVQAYIRGLREHGMLSTVKHFPGHGDTETDTHLGMPVFRQGYGRLDSLELVPFRAGIEAGVDIVMSAHIAFPALTGTDDPGTLTTAVMTGLLRDSLGFKGLVATDALSMGAIVSRYGAGEATVRAFLAGSDLLLIPGSPDTAIAAMSAAVVLGRISPARLDQSVRRVLEVKARLGLFARRTVPLDSILSIVGSRRFQDAADDLAIRSLTLVRDTAGTLRRMRAQPGRVALIAYAVEQNTTAGTRLAEVLRDGATVDFFRLWPMSGPQSYDSARTVIARNPRVVFAAGVTPIAGRGNIALPDALARLITATDSAKPTILVSLGSPYLLNQASAKTFLIAWSGVNASERAVGLALLGKVPIRGKLPIRIPPGYPVGHGLMMGDTVRPGP